VGGVEGEGGRRLSGKINARETALRNGGDGGRITRMGVTAGLPSARARIDERMTCAKDRKHTRCRSEAVERVERVEDGINVFSKKKLPTG
jgi:hypothetical protein